MPSVPLQSADLIATEAVGETFPSVLSYERGDTALTGCC